jgi:hypothetical protein
VFGLAAAGVVLVEGRTFWMTRPDEASSPRAPTPVLA